LEETSETSEQIQNKMTEPEKRKRHPTEITLDSTEEELEFDNRQAGKALTAAKKNFTRSINLVNKVLKEDKENEENLIRGQLLIRKTEDRYELLEQGTNMGWPLNAGRDL
jgi:hypothetical protein